MQILVTISLALICWTTMMTKIATSITTTMAAAAASTETRKETNRSIVYSPRGKVLVADDHMKVPIEISSRLLSRLIVETIHQGLELVKISQLLDMKEYDSCSTSNVYMTNEIRFQLHQMYSISQRNSELHQSNAKNTFQAFDSILNTPVVPHQTNKLMHDILKRFPNENNEYDLFEVLKTNSTQRIPNDAFEPGLIYYNGYNNQTYDASKIKAEMKKDSFWCFKYSELIFSQENWELAVLKFLKNSKLLGQVFHAIPNLGIIEKISPLTKCFLKRFKIEEKFAEFRKKSKLGGNAIYSANYSRIVLVKSSPRTGLLKFEVEIPVFDKSLVYDAFKVLKVSIDDDAKHEVIGVSNRSRYFHTNNEKSFRLQCMKVEENNVDFLCPQRFQAKFDNDIMCLSDFWRLSNGFRNCKVNNQLLKSKKCSKMCVLNGEAEMCSLVCDFWPRSSPLQSDSIHFNYTGRQQ